MGESVLDWLMDHVMPWVLSIFIVIVVLLLIAAPFAIYADSKAERFNLKKDGWFCTKTHSESSTTYVKSGNAMLPITSSHDVCDQWTARE